MRIKKILSVAVVLAMVMAVVPAFGITASAASFGKNADVVSVEFVLNSATPSFRDIVINDIDGKPITGFCIAKSTDGFFAFEREGDYGVTGGEGITYEGRPDGYSKTGVAYGQSDPTQVTITIQNNENSSYTVKYSLTNVNEKGESNDVAGKAIDGTYSASQTYTGTFNGITTPDKWTYTGTYANASINSGTILYYFTNFKVKVGENTVFDGKNSMPPLGGYTMGFKKDYSLDIVKDTNKLIVIEWGNGDSEYRAGIVAFNLDKGDFDSTNKLLYGKLYLNTSSVSNAREFPIYAIDPDVYTDNGLQNCTYTDITEKGVKVGSFTPVSGLNCLEMDLTEYVEKYPDKSTIVFALISLRDGPSGKQQNTQFNVSDAALPYEIREKATVTVKYQANEEDIADSVEVAGLVGDSITIPSEETITKGTTTYVRENDAETHLVESAKEEVIVTYKEDVVDANSITFESPTVTVIEGNKPVLPATTKGKLTTAQTEVSLPIVWNTDSLTVGNSQTVTGTVQGVEGKTVTATVNVLECTDSIEGDIKNAASRGGAGNHLLKYPVTGTATFEFDTEFKGLNNSIVALGDSQGDNRTPAYGWGGDGAAFQVDSTGFNVRSFPGGSENTDAKKYENFSVENGSVTYRFLIDVNLDAHTYSLTATGPDGVAKKLADEYTFRDNTTSVIDDLVVLDFGDSGHTEKLNQLVVSNFRVSAPDSDQKRYVGVKYMVGEEQIGKTNASTVVEASAETEIAAARTFLKDGKLYNAAAVKANAIEQNTGMVEVKATVDEAKIPVTRDGFFTPNLNSDNVTAKDYELYINKDNENSICLYGASDVDPFGLIEKAMAKIPDSQGTGEITTPTKMSKKTRVGYLEFDVPETYVKGDKVTLTLTPYKYDGAEGSKVIAIPTTIDVSTDTKIDGANADFKVIEEEYYASDKLPAEAAAPLKIDVTGVEEYDGKIKFLLVVPNGIVWFANEEKTGFGGDYEGKTAYIEIEALDRPDMVTPELGWDGENFVINVKYGTKKGDKITINGEPQEAGTDGITIETKLTNKVYTVAATLNAVACKEVKTSIYSLVVDEILKEEANPNPNPDKIKAASEVISAGGIYLDGDNLDATTDKVIDYDKVQSTVTMSDKAQALKIGFTVVDGNIYIGSKDTAATPSGNGEGGVYKKMTISIEDNTVTFAPEDAYEGTVAAAAEAITLSLDSVNIEFVETLIEELEAEGADDVQDFIPEL